MLPTVDNATHTSHTLLQSNIRSIPLYPLYGLKGKDDYKKKKKGQNSLIERAERTINKARSCDKAKKN